jgi:aminoglycoside 6'-N-acetyltransferase I
MPAHIRKADAKDVEALGSLRAALWPDATQQEHEADARALTSATPPSTLPLAVFVAESAGAVVGFVEVGQRSHADGCDASRPVGFIEGWFVAPTHRGQGIGRALIAAAESWSRDQGCLELASDTWIDNEPSQRAHEALGFEVVDRCVNYRKDLRR